MKHFRDIQVLQRNGIDPEPNEFGFEVGDHIHVTEKIDGANASVVYNNQALHAFSRKEELHSGNTLRGFFEYVRAIDPTPFVTYQGKVIFGEWLVPHRVAYADNAWNQWYVYDIYDMDNQMWMNQDYVKHFCEMTGMNYIHVIYDGPFTSWEDLMKLLETPSAYGAEFIEGIVVKNMTKLTQRMRYPSYLKIINTQFAETKRIKKELSTEEQELRDRNKEMMAAICTEERVRKEMYKCIDEGLLTLPLQMKDLNSVAKLLPRRIYMDLTKEESTTLLEIGETAGKLSGGMTMQHVKVLLCRGEFNQP